MKRRGWWHWPAAIGSAGALAVLWLALPSWQAQASVLTGYAARATCSCRYVAERSLESCMQDRGPVAGLWAVRIVDDSSSRTVSAQLPLLAQSEARYAAGTGCIFPDGSPGS